MSVFSVIDLSLILQDFSFPHGVQKTVQNKKSTPIRLGVQTGVDILQRNTLNGVIVIITYH